MPAALDIDAVAAFFAPAGPLAEVLPDYEHRAEQVAVATGVARLIERGGALLAEAGTGTGKTLAYLVPALASGLRVVVSTGTKTLQDQLMEKDLPLLERAAGRPLAVQLMKGRTNYLCHVRADRFAAEPPLPGSDARRAYDAIAAWRGLTETGDRAGLVALPDDAPVWRELTANSDQCAGRACPEFERCWVTLMRRKAQVAQLVIVNHHLYFADLALRERAGEAGVALLPAHDLVIFDEAHELDEVAGQHFGYQISDRRLDELAKDVGQSVRASAGLGAQARALTAQLGPRVTQLFDALPFEAGRVRLDPQRLGPHVLERFRAVDDVLEQLESSLADDGEAETLALARRCAALAAELALVLGLSPRASLAGEVVVLDGAEEAPLVHYTERHGRSRALVARPVDVAPLVRDAIAGTSAVFVSGTLRVAGSFAHFRERLGLEGAEELAVGSPFDFERNAKLYLPDDLPEPDAPSFGERAADRAAQLVDAAGGGAFVLCTSHRMLTLMRDHLLRTTSRRVLTQGEQPKRHLIDAFRRDGDAVLVATLSFWSGVDVAGDALRLVIIDKLPFASPADPLVAARMEHLRRTGVDPFRSYQLPQAALLLRQGFGRLVRTAKDRGLVAVLDRRLTHRPYGATFLKSLPPCERLTELEVAREFLASLKAS